MANQLKEDGMGRSERSRIKRGQEEPAGDKARADSEASLDHDHDFEHGGRQSAVRASGRGWSASLCDPPKDH